MHTYTHTTQPAVRSALYVWPRACPYDFEKTADHDSRENRMTSQLPTVSLTVLQTRPPSSSGQLVKTQWHVSPAGLTCGDYASTPFDTLHLQFGVAYANFGDSLLLRTTLPQQRKRANLMPYILPICPTYRILKKKRAHLHLSQPSWVIYLMLQELSQSVDANIKKVTTNLFSADS